MMINEVNEFIRLANSFNLKTNQIKKLITQNNKKILGDFEVTVSFGKGQATKVPWFSVTRYKDYKEDGPVYLYYKDKKTLVLSLGTKEESTTWDNRDIDPKYDFRWDDSISKKYQKIQSYFGEKVDRYNDSYLFKAYNVEGDKVLDESTLESDLTTILDLYRNQLKVHSENKMISLIDFIKLNYSDYKTKYEQQINTERTEFLRNFPLDNLLEMTLAQYSETGNKESYTNFIENKTSTICSGSLGINQNKLFYPKNGSYEVIGPVERAYAEFNTISEKFEQYKKELLQFIQKFDINQYNNLDILKFRSNIIKFKSIRLYRPEVKLFGLPSHHEIKKLLNFLRLDFDNKNDDSISQNIILTNYLLDNYPEIIDLETDIINRLIWDYKTVYVDSSDTVEEESVDISSNGDEDMKEMIDKNLILYGPPGTGKTYNSKNYAVAICESKPVEEVMLEDYNQVLIRYERYVSENRIIFTTFHQSYGYEEFIEGLYPVIDTSTNQIIYRIEDGLFKKFCLTANKNDFETAWNNLTKDVQDGKLKWGDIIETAEDQTKDRLLTLNANGNIIIPYGNGIPFTKESALKFYNGEAVEYASRQGVRYIYEYFEKNYYGSVFNGPRVFIIDEINRGNISKIFGELITLIEESKRAGEVEEMSLILPYSKKLFTVPSNVHILGTMNTADRSIALIDTALRRRFSFEEMMPEPELIQEYGVQEIDGLNLSAMLKAINDRIEVLYDREHTIGHAFFIDKKMDLEKLSHIFRNKIIPLLQEYFYEDYEKIEWVLGDNDKTDESLKFIKKIRNDKTLFKGNVDMNVIPEFRYTINQDAFNNIESYKKII